MISVGLHGLGRFAQHLLYAWLHNPGAISIDFVCDEQLNPEQVCQLLRDHDRLDFSLANPQVQNGDLLLTLVDGTRQRIVFHHGPAAKASWLGLPEYWLECSGRYPSRAECVGFAVGNTKQVLISATCWDADQTLIMGFNHASWRSDARVISYGSCTVNAFVPLANHLSSYYEIVEAEVSIIHNVPAHQHQRFPHPQRRQCTLTEMAPRLLPWLKVEDFFVNYVVIPYVGASLIDMRFRIATRKSNLGIHDVIRQACAESRYALLDDDPGITNVIGNTSNALFFEDGLTLDGDTLRLAGYFDNENSAVRYLELLQWLAAKAN